MGIIRQAVVALMALPSSDRSTAATNTNSRIPVPVPVPVPAQTVRQHNSNTSPIHDIPETVANSMSASSNDTSTTDTNTTHHHYHISNKGDYSIIGQGGIYVEHNWINAEQVAGLQRDIFNLRHHATATSSATSSADGFFQPSGLSNRVDGDPNAFGPSDRLTCTITSSLLPLGNRELRAEVEEKLEHLKAELQEALGIISSNNNNSNKHGLELAEQYYSISPTGSFLPRHMDERHEQTKGDEKGWTTDSRRSISWLVYLNDWDWGSLVSPNAGGELRAYCRRSATSSCGSHDGNVQVGWLSNNNSSETEDGWDNKERYDPVFLDSWVKTPTIMPMLDDDDDADEYDDDPAADSYPSLQWRPLSALYRLVEGNSSSSSSQQQHQQQQERDYISDAFGSDSPSWPSDTNLSAAEFAAALSSQILVPLLHPDDDNDDDVSIRNQHFISTEAIHNHPIDIAPTGGTLVLFDSVAIPHEVLPMTRGERLVMAGWFHEAHQPFPEWYGT